MSDAGESGRSAQTLNAYLFADVITRRDLILITYWERDSGLTTG